MNRIASIAVTAGFALMLTACAQTEALNPPTGKQLPVAPSGSEYRPTAEDLLKPPAQAAPERSVELQKRSQPREDDPFDLPPE